MIVAVANNKGGIGKTTTAETMGAILAERKKKVLLVDFDLQRNLTTNLLKENPDSTVYDFILQNGFRPNQTGIYEVRENLFLIAGSENLAYINLNQTLKKLSTTFKDSIKTLDQKFDYIIIDCPPGIEVMTLTAIASADSVIIPIIPESRPLEGLVSFISFIVGIKKEVNKKLSFCGILITRYNRRRIHNTIIKSLREKYKEIVFESVIRDNTIISEAPLKNKTVLEYAPDAIGTQDYISFVDEFINKTSK